MGTGIGTGIRTGTRTKRDAFSWESTAKRQGDGVTFPAAPMGRFWPGPGGQGRCHLLHVGAWRAAPSLLLPASSWQRDSPCCSFGVVSFIFFTLGRRDVASGTRVCPSARLAAHKPALSLWANWLYLLSFLCCARVYLLLLLLYLFVQGRLFVFLVSLPLRSLCNCPLSMSTGLGGDFGHCSSLGCGQGRLWAAWFSRVPRGAALGSPWGCARGPGTMGLCSGVLQAGLPEACGPAGARLHKVLGNLQ